MDTLEALDGASLYFDSNVFIYALESPDRTLRRRHQALFHYLSEKRCDACTSLLTRAEVLVRPLRLKQIELADRYRMLLSGVGAIGLYGVDEDIVDRAAGLRADYPTLRLPDALHVATALSAGCDAIVTNDLRLNAVSARISVLTPCHLQDA